MTEVVQILVELCTYTYTYTEILYNIFSNFKKISLQLKTVVSRVFFNKIKFKIFIIKLKMMEEVYSWK